MVTDADAAIHVVEEVDRLRRQLLVWQREAAQELNQSRVLLSQREQELNQCRVLLSEREQELTQTRAARAHAEELLREVRASRSWRVGHTIMRTAGRVRRLFRQ